MYGNQAAHMTMNRAAYGDVPAAMMAGGGGMYGGGVPGDAFSQAGGRIMPIGYTPPARVNVTYSGMYAQPTGFFGEMASFMGFRGESRSQMTSDHIYNTASDFGERVGGGLGTAGIMAGALTASAALEPVISGAARAAASAAGMGTFGAGAVGMAAGFAGAGVAMAAADTVVTAVNERRQMNNFLEAQSFRFAGAGSAMSDGRTRGMSRSARAEFTEFARGMDIEDKFMDMGDLQTVLESGTSKGLFAGSGGDMESFKKKFKEVTDAVKVVTRTLGQTLEEGMKTLQELKSIGVDPSQARQFINTADSMGRVAGMSGAEMTQVGLQGANMFRGTGIDMNIGAQANMMNIASVRAARDAGAISEEAVMQAGGEAAMAQRMTASGLAFTQSAMGRGMTAAFVQGGQFNAQSFMANAFGGGGDVRQLGLQAARNLSSPADLIAFQANQEKIVSEMGQQFGGQGLQIAQMNGAMAQASMLSSTTGASMTDAFRATLKSQGMSSQEIDMRMAQINNAGGNFAAMQAGVAKTENAGLIEEASRNFVLTRAGAAIGDVVSSVADVVARPVSGMINSIQEGMTRFKEEQLYGVQRASMGDVDTSVPTYIEDKKVTGDLINQTRRKYKRGGNFFGRVGEGEAQSNRQISLDEGGAFAQSVGEELMKAIESGEFSEIGITAESIKAGGLSPKGSDQRNRLEAFNKGEGILVDVAGGAKRVLMKEELADMQNFVRNSSMTAATAAAMEKRGALKDVNMPDIGKMIASGSFDDVETVDQLIGKVYGQGENRGSISQEEYAKLMNTVQGTSLQGMFDKARKTAGTLGAAAKGVSISEMKNFREVYDAGMEQIQDALGGTITSSAAAKLAAAQEARRQGKSEDAERLMNEASLDIAKSNKDMDIKDVSQFLSKVGEGKFEGALADINVGRAGMMKARQQIGQDKLAGSLLDTLSSKEMDDVDQDVKDKITAVASKLATSAGGITDLSGDDIATISKAGNLGKAMGARLESIQKLASGGVEKMERSEMRSTLEATLGEGRAADIVKKIDAGQKVDFNALVGEAKKKFAGDVAGKEFATAASAGSAEEGTESAMQLAKTQTSINLQVLSAMEALAQRLR